MVLKREDGIASSGLIKTAGAGYRRPESRATTSSLKRSHPSVNEIPTLVTSVVAVLLAAINDEWDPFNPIPPLS